jgi:hypothetical protein
MQRRLSNHPPGIIFSLLVVDSIKPFSYESCALLAYYTGDRRMEVLFVDGVARYRVRWFELMV